MELFKVPVQFCSLKYVFHRLGLPSPTRSTDLPALFSSDGRTAACTPYYCFVVAFVTPRAAQDGDHDLPHCEGFLGVPEHVQGVVE